MLVFMLLRCVPNVKYVCQELGNTSVKHINLKAMKEFLLLKGFATNLQLQLTLRK